MKVFLNVLVILMTLFVVSSCSDDDKEDAQTPQNLVGTTWKCETMKLLDPDLEYVILKFTSATGVEGWTKYKEEEFKREWMGTYTVSGKAITIEEEEAGETFTGTISGVTMNLTVVEGIPPFTFVLQ
ncbi:MAG TPA: hypothetical protein VFG54_03615 [Prolixibacteraceae bacterium]|nr:hypothetical protein [Prolixibacteraceae bacterium]